MIQNEFKFRQKKFSFGRSLDPVYKMTVLSKHTLKLDIETKSFDIIILREQKECFLPLQRKHLRCLQTKTNYFFLLNCRVLNTFILPYHYGDNWSPCTSFSRKPI